MFQASGRIVHVSSGRPENKFYQLVQNFGIRQHVLSHLNGCHPIVLQPQANPVPAMAQPGSHPGSLIVDPEDYSQRWEMIWEAGLQSGQVSDVNYSGNKNHPAWSLGEGEDRQTPHVKGAYNG